MWKWYIIGFVSVIVCSVAVVFLSLDSSTYSNSGATDMRGQPQVSIVLTDAGFRPERVIVDVGTTLIFTTTRGRPFWPGSNPHPSHTLYPELDSKDAISASASWVFVAEKPGVWGYHDHIRSYFTGVVFVE
ncbi:hypothetical protein EXS56_02940 [Candidatus Kaiserbacteria bacterium]|nr:hypothetical protein [Candidatus Kaiserbacteria bacterium]